MKHLLLTTMAAVVLAGGQSQEVKDMQLRRASMEGKIAAVKQHLEAGANVNAKNMVGETPLERAIEFKETKIADLLRKHGGKTGEKLKAEEK